MSRIEDLCIYQAICESRENTTVIRFMKDKDLTEQFIELYMNGDIWGVYYNEDDELVAETNDGKIIKL